MVYYSRGDLGVGDEGRRSSAGRVLGIRRLSYLGRGQTRQPGVISGRSPAGDTLQKLLACRAYHPERMEGTPMLRDQKEHWEIAKGRC